MNPRANELAQGESSGHSGFSWDGEARVEVHTGPAGSTARAGWSRLWAEPLASAGRTAVGTDDHITLVFGATFLMAMVVLVVLFFAIFDPDLFPRLVLALQLTGLAARVVEDKLDGRAGEKMHDLSWDARGVTIDTDGEKSFKPVAQVTAVTWRPVPLYGRWSRLPLDLGGEVALEVDGEEVVAASGRDLPRQRLLARRLAADLGVPFKEESAPPTIVYEIPAEDETPKEGSGGLVATRHAYSSWTFKRSAKGWRATSPTAQDLSTATALVFSPQNVFLPIVLVFDAVGFCWGVITNGPLGLLRSMWPIDPATVLINGVAVGLFVHRFRLASAARRLTVDRRAVVAYVDDVRVAELPLEQIAHIRLESFPAPAVRLVADGKECLLDGLATELDARTLAERLPALIADARKVAPTGRLSRAVGPFAGQDSSGTDPL